MNTYADRERAAVRAVAAAWTDAGPVPAYHHRLQDWLRDDWPILANALDELADAKRRTLEAGIVDVDVVNVHQDRRACPGCGLRSDP